LPLSRGRDALQDYLTKQSQEGFGGSRFLVLRASGEAAKIRVLTEQTEFVLGKFHRLAVTTSTGKLRVGDPILCSEDDTCEVCASITEDSARARLLTFYWVWVYYVDHTRQNPSTRAGTKPWEQVVYGNMVCYREPVEAPRLLLAGSRLAAKMDTYYVRIGSITDRDYTLIRTGEKLETEYNLLADVPAPFRTDIASIIPTLTSLEDIAYGRAGTDDLPTGVPTGATHEERPTGRPAPQPDAGLISLGLDAEPEAAAQGENPDITW